jgi:hypothetical protein
VYVNGFRWTDTCIKGMISFLSNTNTPNIEWEGGHEDAPSGIWIWSKPLFLERETPLAIILNDTRISLINEQTIEDEVLFCEISLRLSSVFIINAMDLSYPNWPFVRFLYSLAQVLKARKSCQFQCFLFLMNLLQMTSTPSIIFNVVNFLLFYFSPIISKFSTEWCSPVLWAR